MESFTWKDFKSGWCPSDDALNGRRDALLQMDNVELDKNGALSLIGGTSVIGSAYANGAHDIFSNVINGTRCDYVSDNSGSIFRNGSSIASGGDSTITAFGVGFNYTLIASGNKRLKDDGTTVTNLGFTTPAAPTVATTLLYTPGISASTISSHAEANATVTWSGTAVSSFATTGVGVTQAPTTSTQDWTSLTNGTDTIKQSVDDVFNFSISDLTNGLVSTKSVTIDFLLVAPTGTTPVSDFYTWTWDNSSGGTTGPIVGLTVKRSDFSRSGGGSQDWSTVRGIRITVVANSTYTTNITIASTTSNGFSFLGGNLRPADYEYVQVAVTVNGSYVGKSQISASSKISTAFASYSNYVTVANPSVANPGANQVWIFRRGGNLAQYYRVLVITSGFGSPVLDNLSDDDAQTLGITVNTNLISVASSSLSDKIKGIIGPIEGRWLYFTDGACYPSDINDPDLIDSSLGVKFSGGNSEIFLWARKVDASTVLIGTSNDVYTLSGTFSTLPDFTVDIYLRPLGCKYPPITYDAAYYSGAVFYLANDGWRSIDTSGNNPSFVSPNTDRLYRGITAYGYSVNTQVTPGTVRFPVAVVANKLWCAINAQSRIEVFDFTRKYWRNISYLSVGDVSALCSTQDGHILSFTNADKKLRILDVQSSLLIDGATKQNVTILSPLLDFGTLRQRKEFYVIKLSINTGGDACSVTLIEDNGTTHGVGSINTLSTFGEFFIRLDTTKDSFVFKTLQIKLNGSFSIFSLSAISFDYDVRPVQVPALHILPNSFGTNARKRLSAISFSIDTLGQDVAVGVYLDGSHDGDITVNSTRKQSFIYQFVGGTNAAAVGGVKDIELFLAGTSCFEFFGLDEPRRLETFPDQTYVYVSPTSNYGSSNRKRIRILKFVLDCLSATVTFTPIIDGVTGTTTNYATVGKQTRYYYFTADQIGVDFAYQFVGTGPFELWEILSPAADDIEVFPDRARFYTLPVTNYGTTSRKRVRLLKFVLDTLANDVTFTPIIDGITQSTTVFPASAGKKTVYHYFTSDQIGVDFSGTFSSAGPFELWASIPPESIDIEIFPDRLRYYRSPKTNFGIDARKRVRAWNYIIDPLGAITVGITIYVDGVAQTTDHALDGLTGKRTGFHLFNPDVTGYDFEFEVIASGPVEIWGVLPPGKDEIEVFPEPVSYYTIPTTNFGYTGRKRVRLLKFVLDTKTNAVIFTPIIDGTPQSTTTFSGNKGTYYHYFTSDQIGTDFGGTLSCSGGSFEVWEILPPEGIDIEKFPDRLKYYRTPKTNFGIDARKRVRTWGYVIDPLGAGTVTINVYVDGTNVLSDTSLSGLTGKRTGWFTFSTDVKGVDWEMEVIATSPIEVWDVLNPGKDEIEVFPEPVQFYQIPTTNYGKTSRKRVRLMKFVLDCRSATVNFNPIIDGVTGSGVSFTGGKKTYYYYFTTDQIGVDFSGVLSGTGLFEVWEVIPPSDIDIEVFPDRLEYFITPKTNFGIDARKRIRTWSVIINALGASSVTAKIYADGALITTDTTLSGTTGKRTQFFFNTSDNIGVDWELEIAANGPFELFDVINPGKDEIEVFPEPVEFFVIPTTNFGVAGRKRLRCWKFVLDCRGSSVQFTPIIDNAGGNIATFTGDGKKTYYYWYTSDQIGIDFSGIFAGNGKFEVWQIMQPESVDIEVFPDKLEYYITPKTNFGVDARKRIRTWSLVINPLGAVTLTIKIYIDGTLVATDNGLNGVNVKKTYWVYLNPDSIGTDFEMEITGSGPFEIFEVRNPGKDEIEIFPEPVKFLTIPTTNFGSATKKRVRVWPFVIDTRGHDVTFTPYVDNVAGPTAVFNTTIKATVFYFFTTDVFGIDYSGTFSGSFPFELWDILQPDVVEKLPIARRFDQVGPEELFRFGRLLRMEMRVLPFGGTTIPYNIYFNDGSVLADNLTVVSGLEQMVSIGVPKGVGGEILRIEVGPTSFNFHRYYMRILVQKTGRDTENQWITLPAPVEEQ